MNEADILPNQLGWALQVINGEKRIVAVRHRGKVCPGNWPYSAKEQLQRQAVSGELKFVDPAEPALLYLDSQGAPVSPKEQAFLEEERRNDDLQRDLKRRAQSLRDQRLIDFAKQRAIDRDWISFAEIVDWRSRHRTDGSIDPQKRLEAINDLIQELSFGTLFYRDGASSVLLTNPKLLDELSITLETPKSACIARERWSAWREILSSQSLEKQILVWCWIPRSVCLSWCANVPFEPKPEWIAEKPCAPDDAVPPLHVKLPLRPNRGEKLRAWLYLKKYFGESGLPIGWSGQKLRTEVLKRLPHSSRKDLPTVDAFKRLVGAKK
jgi:hypothetical protein